MDFFNIPSELSKANSPAYKSGLLRLYRSGGCKDCNAKIGIGMYQNAGLAASRIMPMNPQQVQQMVKTNPQVELTPQQRMQKSWNEDMARRSNTTENTRTTPQNFSAEERANAIPQQSDLMSVASNVAAVMQLGNFIPTPITQGIGKLGNIIGTGLDVYQLGDNLYQGDYKSAGLNLGMALLPNSITGVNFNQSKNLYNKNFKSEIDWGKWNPDTPKYPELINEYNAIEESTKKAGTWMKNPDGSAFQGTPEQFIQQQSSYFKKAFGDSKLVNPDGSPMFLYHGSAKKFDTFDPSKFQLGDAGYSGAGIYTTPSKVTANSYATSSAKFHSGDIEPTVYQLYGQGDRPIKSSDLIKENQGRDLFNFYRDRNWQGELSPYESLREYDVAVSDQLPNVQNIRPLHDAREIVFPTNTQLKSATGNVGFFDMTNPNIYKAIAPVGVSGAALYKASQTEEPQYKKGGMIKRADGSYSQRGLWDNIRANRGSGKKPTKEMLKQERKIKAKYQEGGMSSEVPNSGTTIVYNKNDEKLLDYTWLSKKYTEAPTLEERLANPEKLWVTDDRDSTHGYINSSYIKYAPTLNSDSHYKELKVCDECGWDDEMVNVWKNAFPGIKGFYTTPSGHRHYVLDAPTEIVEYQEPPKIKNVWGEQIYTPNTNVSNIDAKRKAGTLQDYRYVVETEDGGLVELSNQEQYKKYKEKYGFDGNSLNVKYGRMPQFTTQPVVTTFERGGVIKDDRGQWAHPGKVTQINSPNITMKGVPYPVLGISDAGDTQMMMPNGEYQFSGNKVTEYPLFGKGGYTVRKTNERKGKTHVVIGPGGKKKYFGDPSMGERSKSKYGKEAFYKRHAKNLKSNPYFRAYARATWSDGGIVRDIEPFNLSSY